MVQGVAIELLTSYADVTKKIMSKPVNSLEKKPTEQSIICQIIKFTYLGVTVNVLCWVNIEGYHRRKAAGVLSVSVPVHGDSCWYS